MQGTGAIDVAVALAPVVLLGLAARHPRLTRRGRASMVSIGLLAASAALVQLSHGTTEAHFHFFVMVTMLAMYEEWVPYLLSLGFVLLHHGLMGSLVGPSSVFDHEGGAWQWALVHAAFIAGLAVVNIVAWRLNEDQRTEARHAHARTVRSETQFRGAFDSAPVGMALVSLEGRLVRVNEALRLLCGQRDDQLVGRPLADIFLGPTAWRSSEEAGSSSEERQFLRADGTLGWALCHRHLVLDERGEPWHYSAQAVDISERRDAEELLEHQRAQLIEAQSVGRFGSWEWDITANSVAWSDELYRLYGVDRDAGPRTSESFQERVHPDDRDAVQAQVCAASASGEPFSLEHRIVRPDGGVRVMELRGKIVHGSDGTAVRMVGTGQDITERHEIERAKDEFVSIVSHELRTPLTAIRGSLGLLGSGVLGPLSAKSGRMVEIAVQNTDRLVRLINDILDIERIASGTAKIHQEPCDARELIERASQSLTQLGADARVCLTTEGEPVPLIADQDRVLRTLTNLISNAVKFSPAGSTVRLSSSRLGTEALFTVSDTGRGIPPEHLDSIFERFSQVDSSDEREKGGTGLGLAICRKIVELHGGRIWVESKLGIGSTFFFTLPAQATDGSPPPHRIDGGQAPVGEDGDAVLEGRAASRPVPAAA